jgi:PAS domain S-box-containing protein
LICKDGTRRFTEISVSPIKTADKNITGFRGIVRDITERKQAEEALRESEARISAILDAIPDLMFVQSRDGTYLDYHAVNSEALYVPPEQFLGRKMHDIFPKDFADNLLGLINQAVDTNQMQIHEYRLPIAGQLRHFEARILSYGDDKVLSIIREVTERKKAEDEIRKLNAELVQRVEERTHELRQAQEQLIRQEKLAVLGQLAGGVGHELRNPLAVITNAVYFLKLIQPEADEKVKEYLGMIERETHTAEKIITDLLDFARIKSVDRELVSVPELAQRVLVRYPPPASVTVSLGFPASLPQVQVDPRQMEQVLGNLVVNAFQAMPQGGKLTLSAKKKGTEIALAVADTGVGIPPENMPKLFEPLFTTKLKGIGLGLAVCKKLAEANSGRIEVQSEPGKGSTFTLYLPTT